MRRLLAIAAAGESATGLALLVYPPIAVRPLFGAEIAGAGVVMSRIAGMSLIAFGLACWPGGKAGSGATKGAPGNAELQPARHTVPRLSGRRA
jgi:hypothetical protein